MSAHVCNRNLLRKNGVASVSFRDLGFTVAKLFSEKYQWKLTGLMTCSAFLLLHLPCTLPLQPSRQTWD